MVAHAASGQGMPSARVSGEDAGITHHVKAARRDERAKTQKELARLETQDVRSSTGSLQGMIGALPTYDIVEIARWFESGDATPPGAWLERSREDPDGFNAALGAFHAGRGTPPGKSRVGEGYDLYHDMVVRHLGLGRVALRWLGARGASPRSPRAYAWI
jgi:hypothetical protein